MQHQPNWSAEGARCGLEVQFFLLDLLGQYLAQQVGLVLVLQGQCIADGSQTARCRQLPGLRDCASCPFIRPDLVMDMP